MASNTAQFSSEVSFEAAQRRVDQLEGALRAFGDATGPDVKMLQECLKSAKRAAQVPPVTVQLTQCEQFIAGGETVGSAGRGANLVGEAVGGGSAAPSQTSRGSFPVQPWWAQVASLQQMVNAPQSERDAVAAQIRAKNVDASRPGTRRPVRQRIGPGQNMAVMPTFIPAELSQWTEDRQADLQDAFANDDDVRVLGLTSIMAKVAERLIHLTRQPGTSDDEFVLRGAGEGRFAPY